MTAQTEHKMTISDCGSDNSNSTFPNHVRLAPFLKRIFFFVGVRSGFGASFWIVAITLSVKNFRLLIIIECKSQFLNGKSLFCQYLSPINECYSLLLQYRYSRNKCYLIRISLRRTCQSDKPPKDMISKVKDGWTMFITMKFHQNIGSATMKHFFLQAIQ